VQLDSPVFRNEALPRLPDDPGAVGRHDVLRVERETLPLQGDAELDAVESERDL